MPTRKLYDYGPVIHGLSIMCALRSLYALLSFINYLFCFSHDVCK
jgi:hypothetical protein